MADKMEDLEKRIKDLEKELVTKDQDIAVYRSELLVMNKKLEALLGGLSQELELAQKIHKALVPTVLPHIPDFHFSTKFVSSASSGSDYFDVFQQKDRSRFGLICVSSSNYVMSGLILSGLLSLNDKMMNKETSRPEVFLKELWEGVKPSIGSEQKAEIFYAIFNRVYYRLDYWLAGNICAVVQDNENKKISVLPSTSGPIAEDFSPEGEVGHLQLGQSDRLILCSPGLLNAQNEKGEPFGRERFFKVVLGSQDLDVHGLRNNIFYTVQSFQSGKELTQDMTVLVVEARNKIIQLAQ